MNKRGDIDIDFADRSLALSELDHIPASMIRNQNLVKHNSGVYFHAVPIDSITVLSSLEYNLANAAGFYKIDFLNVGIYQQIKSEQHLVELMNHEPNWDQLYDHDFCSRLIHVGNHYSTLIKMPEKVNSIVTMSMFLAVIRPGKRQLIGQHWQEISQTVWDNTNDGYAFKRSHAIAYAHLVKVHMNLLNELDSSSKIA